ncbi:hypothetical protein TRVA0_055S00342 [Trichomonascus vanleenenianus]|uniref:SSH4 family protein n=1 Tax=Trichomonascus vanleenenianus TaxID=2268995 RepID=UPI003EC97997
MPFEQSVFITEEEEYPSINVPLLIGLLSGLGTLLLGLLCGAIWFALTSRAGRIRLGTGEAGQFDDDESLLEQEEEALEHMDNVSRESYLRAKAFIEANPPNSASTDISLSQFMTIQEKGVSAWEFEPEFPHANCFVEGRTEIEFFDSVCCVQTNLPVPKQNDVYYWEAKIYDKPLNTVVAVGLATKPYPTFRLPGYHRYSVAYDSTGVKRNNQPFLAPHYGPPLQPGDVVGVGYRTRTGTIFFTRNGKKLDDALHGVRLNMFPTIGATGPASVVVNFGQAGFVFIEANVKKWGLAPAHGSLAPPPPYGAEHDFVLLETGREPAPSACSSSNQVVHPPSHPPPPFSRSEPENNDEEGINLASLHRLHSPPPSYTSGADSDSETEADVEEATANDENEESSDSAPLLRVQSPSPSVASDAPSSVQNAS